MADTNKNVKINIEVTGKIAPELSAFAASFRLAASSLAGLQGSMKAMEGIAVSSAASLQALSTSVSKLEVPENLTTFITELKKAGDITFPNLESFTKGLKELSSTKVPTTKKMADIVTALSSLKDIKVPKGLNDFAKGLKVLQGIPDSSNAITNINRLAVAFRLFDKMTINSKLATDLRNVAYAFDVFDNATVDSKKINSLMGALKSLQKLEVDKNAAARIAKIAAAFEVFDKVKIPSLTALMTSLKKFTGFTIDPNLEPTLNELSRIFQTFKGIKVPNLNALFGSLGKFKEFKVDPNLKTSLQDIKDAFIVLDKVKVPNLNSLWKSLEKSKDVKIPDDLDDKLKTLKTAFDQFKGVKIPNLNALTSSLGKFEKVTIPDESIQKIDKLVELFKKFDKIRIPNLGTLAKSVKAFEEVNISDKFVANLTQIQEAFKNFKGIKVPNLKGLADSIKSLEGVTIPATLGETFTDLAKALRVFQGAKVPAIGAMVKGMEQLMKLDVEAFTKKVEHVSAAINKLDNEGRLQSFKGFAEALKAVEKKIGHVSMAAEASHKAVGRYAFAFASATAGLSAFNQKLYGLGRGLSAINSGFAQFTGFGALFGSFYAIKNVTNDFIDFDDAIKKAGATSRATIDQMEELARAARLMGEATRYTSVEAAQGLQELTMAGLSVNEAIAALPGVLQLAAASGVEVKDAAHISANVMRGYGMEVSDLTSRMKTLDDGSKQIAASINDVLVAAFTRSNTDLTALAVAFRYAGPIAKSAGMQFEETASILASLAQAGYQGSTAGTTLRRAIANLLAPTEKMNEVLKHYGVTVIDINTGALRPMIDILADLRNAGISTGDALELFGKRAGAGMISLLDTATSSLVNMRLAMEQAAGESVLNAAKMESGIGGAWRRLQSVWEELKLSLGAELESDMIEFFQLMTKTLRDNKQAIVDSVGAILNIGQSIIKLTSYIAANAAEYSKTLIVMGVFAGLAHTMVPPLIRMGRALDAGTHGVKALATAAVPAIGAAQALKEAVKHLATSTAGFIGRLSPLVLTLGGVSVAVAGLAAAYLLLHKSKSDVVNDFVESGDAANKESKRLSEQAAIVKLLTKDLENLQQARALVKQRGGGTSIPIGPEGEKDTTKASQIEENLYIEALRRTAAAVQGAEVVFDQFQNAFIKVNGVIYDGVEALDQLGKKLKESADAKALKGVEDKMKAVNLALERQQEIQKQILSLEEEQRNAKPLNPWSVSDFGKALSDTITGGTEGTIKVLKKEHDELTTSILASNRAQEEFLTRQLNSGKTIQQVTDLISSSKTATQAQKDQLLSLAKSSTFTLQRLSEASKDIENQIAKDTKAFRQQETEIIQQLTEETEALNNAIKETIKITGQFTGNFKELADFKFGQVDNSDAVRSAQEASAAISRVYIKDTDERKKLILEAETKINEARTEETIKAAKEVLREQEIIHSTALKAQYELQENILKSEKSKGYDKVRITRQYNDQIAKLDQEAAKVKIQVFTKVADAIKASLEHSLATEVSLKNRLEDLLKKSQEFSDSFGSTLRDNIREGMTPLGQYLDKVREIESLTSGLDTLKDNGEYEKFYETLNKIETLTKSLGAGVTDDGRVVVSKIEAANKQLDLLNKARAKEADVKGKYKDDLQNQIANQEKLTTSFQEQMKSVQTVIDKLQATIQEGIKLEIKIDINAANAELDELKRLSGNIVYTTNLKEAVQKDIRAVEAEAQEQLIKLYQEAKLSDRMTETEKNSPKGRAILQAEKNLYEAREKYNRSIDATTGSITKNENVARAAAETVLTLENQKRDSSSNTQEAHARATKTFVSGQQQEQKAIAQSTSAIVENAQGTIDASKQIVDSNTAVAQSATAVADITDGTEQKVQEAFAKTKQSYADHANSLNNVSKTAQVSAEDRTASEILAATKIKAALSDVEAKMREFASTDTSGTSEYLFQYENHYAQLKDLEADFNHETEKLERASADKKEEIARGVIDSLEQLQEDAARDERDRARDLAKKLEDIDQDLVDKRAEIREDFNNTLRELLEDQKKIEKKTAAAILDLETEKEDKIAAIRGRGDSDKKKEYKDRIRAAQKYKQALDVIEEGKKKADSAEIERGIALLKQSSDLYEGLKNEKQAISGIQAVYEKLGEAYKDKDAIEFIEKRAEAERKSADSVKKAVQDQKNAVRDAYKDDNKAAKDAKTKLIDAQKDIFDKAAEATRKANEQVSDKQREYILKEFNLKLQGIKDSHQAALTAIDTEHQRKMVSLQEQAEKARDIYLQSGGDIKALPDLPELKKESPKPDSKLVSDIDAQIKKNEDIIKTFDQSGKAKSEAENAIRKTLEGLATVGGKSGVDFIRGLQESLDSSPVQAKIDVNREALISLINKLTTGATTGVSKGVAAGIEEGAVKGKISKDAISIPKDIEGFEYKSGKFSPDALQAYKRQADAAQSSAKSSTQLQGPYKSLVQQYNALMDPSGVTPITAELTKNIDILTDKASRMFAGMSTDDPKQKIQDMVTVLNQVNASATANESELASMFNTAKQAAADAGLQIGISIGAPADDIYRLYDKAGIAVLDVSDTIKSNPFELFTKEQQETVLKGLDFVGKKVDNVTEKKPLRIDTKETTQNFKKFAKIADDVFAGTNKDVNKLGKALDKVDGSVLSEDFKEIGKEADKAFSTGIEGAEDFNDAAAKAVPPNMVEELEEATETVEEFKEVASDPAKFAVDNREALSDVEELNKAVEGATKAVEEDVEQEVAIDGQEDVVEVKEDLGEIADQDGEKVKMVVEVEYRKTGDVPENNTEVIPSGNEPSENKEGGLIQAIGNFANGGRAIGRTFKRLATPYISAGDPGSKVDDVPAMLQHGEFVHKRAAVSAYGTGVMKAINEQRIPPSILRRMASNFNVGGMVSRVGSMVQNFATGGLAMRSAVSRMKRRFEEDTFGHTQAATNSMNLTMNNVIQSAPMQTSMGNASAAALRNIISNSIGRFAEGGEIDSASIAKARQELESKYSKEIAVAKAGGNNKLAEILKKEKEELDKVAKELVARLQKIETEHKEFLKTTTEEHNARIAEIETSYNTEKPELDNQYAQDVSDLNSEYAKDLADIAESEGEDKLDYDEAIAQYKKDKEDLKKEYAAQALEDSISYREARVSANKLGKEIGLAWKKAKDEYDTEIASKIAAQKGTGFAAANNENPYKITGTSSPDFALMRTLIEELWPGISNTTADGILGGQISALSNLTIAGKDKAAIGDLDPTLLRGGTGHTSETAIGWLKDIADFKTTIDELHPDAIKARFNEEFAAIVAEEDKEKQEYAKKAAEYAAEKAENKQTYEKELAELQKSYTEESNSLNSQYALDKGEENSSFKKSIEEATAQYKQDKIDAELEAGESYKTIKDTAKEEYATVSKEIAESVDKLTGTLGEELKKLGGAEIIFGRRSNEEIINRLFRKFFNIRGFNTGGYVNPTSGSVPGKDSILAKLAPDEFVMQAPVVNAFGRNFFEALNAFQLPSTGVSGIMKGIGSSGLGTSKVIHELALSVNGNQMGALSGPQSTIEDFITALSLAQRRM